MILKVRHVREAECASTVAPQGVESACMDGVYLVQGEQPQRRTGQLISPLPVSLFTSRFSVITLSNSLFITIFTLPFLRCSAFHRKQQRVFWFFTVNHFQSLLHTFKTSDTLRVSLCKHHRRHPTIGLIKRPIKT